MYDLSVYDEEFYNLVEREGLAMAHWFVPLLIDVFRPKELINRWIEGLEEAFEE